jgi:hypothetical protein
VNVSDVPAGCSGRHVAVTFYDSSDAPVGSAVDATLPVGGSTESISVSPSSNMIDVGRIGGVSLTIS